MKPDIFELEVLNCSFKMEHDMHKFWILAYAQAQIINYMCKTLFSFYQYLVCYSSQKKKKKISYVIVRQKIDLFLGEIP